MNIRKFSASGTAWKLAGIVCGVILLALPVFALASHTEDGEDNGGTTSIEGVKENTSGDPVEGWEIRLYDESGETIIHFAETDEDGRYRFSGLVEGTYLVCEDADEDHEQTSPKESDSIDEDVARLVECVNNTIGYEVDIDASETDSIFMGLDFVNEGEGENQEDEDEEGDIDEDDEEDTDQVEDEDDEDEGDEEDDDGEEDDEDDEDGLDTDDELTVACAVGPAISVRVGQRVTFAAAANGEAPYTYMWSGDVSGAGLTVSTVFATTGTRTGKVDITDAEGREGDVSCSVEVLSGGVGGAPGEGSVSQAPPATPPTDTDTDGETTPDTATPTEEGDEEAEEGEGAAGGAFSRDNLWWIVLAVIVIALAAYYLWERQRGTGGQGGGKQQPPAAPPAT